MKMKIKDVTIEVTGLGKTLVKAHLCHKFTYDIRYYVDKVAQEIQKEHFEMGKVPYDVLIVYDDNGNIVVASKDSVTQISPEKLKELEEKTPIREAESFSRKQKLIERGVTVEVTGIGKTLVKAHLCHKFKNWAAPLWDFLSPIDRAIRLREEKFNLSSHEALLVFDDNGNVILNTEFINLPPYAEAFGGVSMRNAAIFSGMSPERLKELENQLPKSDAFFIKWHLVD